MAPKHHLTADWRQSYLGAWWATLRQRMSNLKPTTTEHIPIYCHLAFFQILTSSLCSHGSVRPTWAKWNSLRPTSHAAFHTETGETQHLHPQPGHGLGLNQASSLVAIGGMGCQGMIQSIGPAFQMHYGWSGKAFKMKGQWRKSCWLQ